MSKSNDGVQHKTCWACRSQLPDGATKCVTENCGCFQGWRYFFSGDLQSILTVFGLAVGLILGINEVVDNFRKQQTISSLTEKLSKESENLTKLRGTFDDQVKLIQEQRETERALFVTTLDSMERDTGELIQSLLKNQSAAIEKIKNQTDRQERLEAYRRFQLIENGDFVVRDSRQSTDNPLREAANSDQLLSVVKLKDISLTVVHSGASGNGEKVDNGDFARSFGTHVEEVVIPEDAKGDVVGFGVDSGGLYNIASLRIRKNPLIPRGYHLSVIPIHRDAVYQSGRTKSHGLTFSVSAFVLSSNK